MNEAAIIDSIVTTFEGVQVEEAMNSWFFSYEPQRKFPFATLVTDDTHDTDSDLNRPGVFRLNIGVDKQTFRSLFGAADATYDFTALDQLMPHPVYGNMYWVCILNPSKQTFLEVVEPLLAEAYQLDVAKHTRRAAQS